LRRHSLAGLKTNGAVVCRLSCVGSQSENSNTRIKALDIEPAAYPMASRDLKVFLLLSPNLSGKLNRASVRGFLHLTDCSPGRCGRRKLSKKRRRPRSDGRTRLASEAEGAEEAEEEADQPDAAPHLRPQPREEQVKIKQPHIRLALSRAEARPP
jgi:hypothetical protein